MRTTNQCPKCGGLSIGHLEQMYEAQPGGPTWSPVAQVLGFLKRRGIGGSDSPLLGACAEPAGVIEAYVCADCGFFETYVKQPETLAFADLRGFTWHAKPGQGRPGPYR